MDVIREILKQTEDKLNKQLLKVKSDIEFNPYTESVAITNALGNYLNNPNPDEGEFEKLQQRKRKNDRDIKRVSHPKYLERLFARENDIERQQRDIYKFKIMTGIAFNNDN